MATSDNVLTKLHDLLLYLIPQLSKFPRDQKFLLGDRIETRLLDVQERCLRAYYSREKRVHLQEANLLLELVRHLVRLAHDMKFFSRQRYAGQEIGTGYISRRDGHEVSSGQEIGTGYISGRDGHEVSSLTQNQPL